MVAGRRFIRWNSPIALNPRSAPMLNGGFQSDRASSSVLLHKPGKPALSLFCVGVLRQIANLYSQNLRQAV